MNLTKKLLILKFLEQNWKWNYLNRKENWFKEQIGKWNRPIWNNKFQFFKRLKLFKNKIVIEMKQIIIMRQCGKWNMRILKFFNFKF